MEINPRHLGRVKMRDKIARGLITLGGISIILSVVAILVLIAKVSLPLFGAAHSTERGRVSLPHLPGPVMDLGLDNYLETGYVLDQEGGLTFFNFKEKKRLEALKIAPPGGAKKIIALEKYGQGQYTLLWDNGFTTAGGIKFAAHFDKKGRRSILHKVEIQKVSLPDLKGLPTKTFFRKRETGWLWVGIFPDKKIRVVSQNSGEASEEAGKGKILQYTLDEEIPGAITASALDGEGTFLYLGTSEGFLLRWDFSDPLSPKLQDKIPSDGAAITALHLVFGDLSLAVGDKRGGLITYFAAPSSSGGRKLKAIHPLKSHSGSVVSLVGNRRDKCILSLDEKGVAHLDHMTSESHLLKFQDPSPLTRLGLSTNGKGLVALAGSELILWEIENPHPEISWKTLFGKVWYESYDKSEYVWQSSSASDDFEAKFSLVPLIFGTLKGTLYAMLFALPLALFGAIYTSQFAHRRYRPWIKNTVEIMAAVPSVVIGFLIALWMAPLVEKWLVALFLSLLILPVVFFAFLFLWHRFKKRRPPGRVGKGNEFLLLIPVILVGALIAGLLGSGIDSYFFGGKFKLWLYQSLHVHYDQRNCIIIAFGLGFAVIPIIFSLSEDSLSAVPPSLSAASLALGASRWQTLWRVILPAASPGIFAAVMIGFGRAVGETMIVLMATGNTPIMEWSIFNGMRTLSANIAVEVSEAPVGGTLFRVLFLCAVILFMMTFVFNTLAEIVRERLRKKYGRF